MANTSYHKKELKEQILYAAIETVKTSGYQEISTRKLASQLNVSSAAIYRHYQSIDELFSSVIHVFSEIFAASLKEHTEHDASAVDILEIIAENFVQFAQKESHVFRLLFLSPYSKSDVFSTTEQELATVSFFRDLVRKLCQENQLVESEESLFIKLWSFIFGYALLVENQEVSYDQAIIHSMIQDITARS